MVTITREQAICMFYHQPYDKKKANDLLKAIENIQTEICYRDDPTRPLLLYKNSIHMDPINNHTYSDEIEKTDMIQDEICKKEIVTVAQLIDFLNAIFLPMDPNNKEAFFSRSLTMNDILSVVWKYTDILNDKTAHGFSKWCGARKLELMKAHIKRKQGDSGNKYSTRNLYVLKDQYIHHVLRDIVEILPRHKNNMENLKENGYTILGYVRKSIGDEEDETRIRLLNQMCRNVRERSLVTKVFASVACKASQPLLDRDLTKNTKILSEVDAEGDMQDMLKYIGREEKVCIVAIDFAGLTTNCEDLKLFLKNNSNIHKIVIDKLPYNNSIYMFDSAEILNDSDNLQKFNCRNNTLPRRSSK